MHIVVVMRRHIYRCANCWRMNDLRYTSQPTEKPGPTGTLRVSLDYCSVILFNALRPILYVRLHVNTDPLVQPSRQTRHSYPDHLSYAGLAVRMVY